MVGVSDFVVCAELPMCYTFQTFQVAMHFSKSFNHFGNSIKPNCILHIQHGRSCTHLDTRTNAQNIRTYFDILLLLLFCIVYARIYIDFDLHTKPDTFDHILFPHIQCVHSIEFIFIITIIKSIPLSSVCVWPINYSVC